MPVSSQRQILRGGFAMVVTPVLSDDSSDVELLGAQDLAVRARAFDSLTAAGPASVDALIAGARHANWRVRRGCADLMDHLADDRCAEALVRLLHDPVAAVRLIAIHALGCQPPDPRAAVFLQRLLERENDAGIVSRARWALSQQERS